jgi:4-amino-4-deoxy-L-arabinose transferase-like glycosyltransferase
MIGVTQERFPSTAVAATANHDRVQNEGVSRIGATALVALTLLCLLPFSGKAFHIDDPVYLWTAKQIVEHPLNPYGFDINWSNTALPMWEATPNPPLVCYYAALVGRIAGWSERALHLGFLLPALAAVLGAYRLAGRFTRQPWLAAAATLLAPGLLVSATGIMCDTMMVALWIWATVFWVEGLDDPQKPLSLAISGLLISACALTKYFGICLIPLLFVYSIMQKRAVGRWLWFLLIPLVVLGGYEAWTYALYGHGTLWFGLQFTAAKGQARRQGHFSAATGHALVGLAFAGGCTLPALTFGPLLWSRKQLFVGGIAAIMVTLAYFLGWISMGSAYPDPEWLYRHAALVNTQLALCLAGGISVLALAISDLRERGDAPSLLLFLWVAGTFLFAVFVNWQVNARSLLPLIPAAAILTARRLDETQLRLTVWRRLAVIVPLIISGAVSLWAAWGDEELANTARTMAEQVRSKSLHPSTVRFQGHWGFQYYMELIGAQPLDNKTRNFHPGDLLVLPVNNANLFELSSRMTPVKILDFKIGAHLGTMSRGLGAGFYSSDWGVLPFAIGPVADERYYVVRGEEGYPWAEAP